MLRNAKSEAYFFVKTVRPAGVYEGAALAFTAACQDFREKRKTKICTIHRFYSE
jgi:hypothetical protein